MKGCEPFSFGGKGSVTIRTEKDLEPIVGQLYAIESPSMIADCTNSESGLYQQAKIPENSVLMFLGWEVVHMGNRGVIHLRARFLGPEDTFCFIIAREVYIGCQKDYATSGALQKYLNPEHEVWRGYFYVRGGIRLIKNDR